MNTDITFSPITINSLAIKNRLVMSSMVTQYAAGNGEVTDQMINYYADRARGGVGLVMVEATYVERQGNSYRLGLGIDSDAMLPGLTRLTRAVHACGGKIGIQLQHGGRTANPQTNGGPVNATKTVAMYLYQYGFQFYKMGYACAAAYVLFILVFIVSLIQNRSSKNWAESSI